MVLVLDSTLQKAAKVALQGEQQGFYPSGDLRKGHEDGICIPAAFPEAEEENA